MSGTKSRKPDAHRADTHSSDPAAVSRDPTADVLAENTEEDLSQFVQDLLQQMQSRFQQMSAAIISRIDDMGDRIDGLEKSIGDLMHQAGVDEIGERLSDGQANQANQVKPEKQFKTKPLNTRA